MNIIPNSIKKIKTLSNYDNVIIYEPYQHHINLEDSIKWKQ